MPQDRTRKIVVTGILGAIIVFLNLTPFGFIPWAGVSLTLIHIPVIIGAVIEGPIVGLVLGFIFGITSLLRAAYAPNSILDPYFVNPLISILPRLFIGPVAWLTWRALKRWPVIGLLSAGIAGSLTNTILVLTALGLSSSAMGVLKEATNSLNVGTLTLLWGIVIASGLPEAIVAGVLTLLIAGAWMRIQIGNKKGADLT